MTAVPSDTLSFAKQLEGHGFTRDQAEALADGIRQFTSSSVATKTDLLDVEIRLTKELNHLESRLTRVEATLAIVVALLVAIAVKLFWFH